MKKVFVIRYEVYEIEPNVKQTWIRGRRGQKIRFGNLTKSWLNKNGFLSEGAAVRQLKLLGSTERWSCGDGACVESFEVPERELHYEIYRPYEIVILDKDGNQVGDTQYCYGSRAQAESLAEYEVEIAENR